jgi:signal transduction histidine kinase/CheY-like chemotaxis protein
VQSAQQIRQQAAELHDKNQRLEKTQAALEARTQQLSKLNAELQLEMAERARTEVALRQKQKLESIGLLAGGVAHDFNNLLTSILSQSSLALRRLAPEQAARQHVEKAIQSTQQAADLTRQLLAYAGKATFQVEPVDLNQLIQANSGLFETVLRGNATLHVSLQTNLPAVAADRGQLQQVLMNLIINASEAIEHEHGKITLKTYTVDLQSENDPTAFVGIPPSPGAYVCLAVTDNGVGMDATILEKIFDPFFSTKARGHGLGLSAVLGVVQALHGGLQVQSAPQSGTVFCVYLPATNEYLPVSTTTTSPNPLAHPNGLVLVIDDEDLVREAVAEMLNSVGYRTLVAANGTEGLALFNQFQNEIGTVLLDVVMPGMSGTETLQKLRTVDTQVKVILSSGYVDTALPGDLLEHTHTTFLAKPYTLEQLLRVMASVT